MGVSKTHVHKQPWLERFMEEYIEASGYDPTEAEDDADNALKVRTHRSVAAMVTNRCQGMDCRKIALLAADMFQYHLASRMRAIEEVAMIAAKDVSDIAREAEEARGAEKVGTP